MPRKLKDWLQAYAEYTSESESPEVFHVWVALSTIAGAAQRKIMMRTAYFDVLTNMFVILVSPPGRGKKTTALRIGKNLLKSVEPKVNFATESASPEALIGLMSKITNQAHQSMTLYSSELGTLMSTKAEAMVDFLMDIYDGNPDWERQTVAHDLQKITRPWLNIAAGTTPKWLGENMGVVAAEGGLVARCLFAYSDERLLRSPFPRETERMKALKKDLIHDLCIISALEGEFDFDKDAEKYYNAWYLDESRFPAILDPRTASYYDRKHIHMLKVAMALSLSYKDELVLTLPDIQRAKVLLDSAEPGMRTALAAMGKNEHASELVHVLSQIKSKQSISYKDLLVENYHNLGKKQLDIVLDELVSMGRIKPDRNGNFVYVALK